MAQTTLPIDCTFIIVEEDNKLKMGTPPLAPSTESKIYIWNSQEKDPEFQEDPKPVKLIDPLPVSAGIISLNIPKTLEVVGQPGHYPFRMGSGLDYPYRVGIAENGVSESHFHMIEDKLRVLGRVVAADGQTDFNILFKVEIEDRDRAIEIHAGPDIKIVTIDVGTTSGLWSFSGTIKERALVPLRPQYAPPSTGIILEEVGSEEGDLELNPPPPS